MGKCEHVIIETKTNINHFVSGNKDSIIMQHLKKVRNDRGFLLTKGLTSHKSGIYRGKSLVQVTGVSITRTTFELPESLVPIRVARGRVQAISLKQAPVEEGPSDRKLDDNIQEKGLHFYMLL